MLVLVLLFLMFTDVKSKNLLSECMYICNCFIVCEMISAAYIHTKMPQILFLRISII